MTKSGLGFVPVFRYLGLWRYVEGVLNGPDFGPARRDRFWVHFLAQDLLLRKILCGFLLKACVAFRLAHAKHKCIELRSFQLVCARLWRDKFWF